MMLPVNKIICGDALTVLKTFPDNSIDCCVTSPPYWGLRNYGVDGQLGLEKTPEEYVAKMVEVFREVKRVLKKEGTLWLNLGDSYAGSGKGQTADGCDDPKQPKLHGMKLAKNNDQLPAKNLIGIPWRVAFALQADGWYLRQDIIWHKPNPMPESVRDRCTKAHEYIFMLSKSARYYYDQEAIKEPAIYAGLPGQDKSGYKDAKQYNGKHSDKQRGHSRRHAGFNDRWDAMPKGEQCGGMRNKRSVWNIATKPYSGAHFATFPPEIPERCIKAGSKVGDIILDPFAGSGTTLEIAKRLGRAYIGIELNSEYVTNLPRHSGTICKSK